MIGVSDFVGGVLILVAVLACCSWVAAVTLQRWFSHLDGSPRAVAAATAFSAALIAVHLVPGALGQLRVATVLAGAAALAAAAGLLWRRHERPPQDRHGGPAAAPGSRVSRALAAGVTAMVAGSAAAYVAWRAGMPITSIDAMNFQVPTVARWLQSQSLWGLHQFYPDYSNATYPHNGNLLVTAVVLPFRSPFLAQLVPVPFWVLSGVAMHALARELGASVPTAALSAAAWAAIPVNLLAALEGVQTDAPMLAFLVAGVLFLLRHHRTGVRAELVLAGVALGLAFGTKWYAVPAVAVLLLVWALGRLRSGEAIGRLVGEGAAVLGLVLLAGGFWLLRNLVATSNPFFPQELSLLGVELFAAPPDPLRDIGGFTIAHYALDLEVWSTYLLPALWSSFALVGVVAVAAIVAGTFMASRRRRDGRIWLVVLAAVLLAVAYAITPFSAFGPEGQPLLAHVNTRYGLPAVAAGIAAAAWISARGARRRSLMEAAFALGALHALLTVPLPRPDLRLAAGGVLALAVAAVGWRAPGLQRRPGVAVALCLGGALAVVLVAWHRERAVGYGDGEPAIAWIERHAPVSARIGLAGVWSNDGLAPPLPAFGPRLENEVAYVGVFRRDMLRRFESEADFVRALRGFDLLVVGRERNIPEMLAGPTPGPTGPIPEEEWAQRAGFVTVAASERLTLLRAPGFRPGG